MIKDDLINEKEKFEKEWVTIMNNGKEYDDPYCITYRMDVQSLYQCNNLYQFLRRGVRESLDKKIAFDRIDYEVAFGLTYDVSTLGEKHKILPTSKFVPVATRYCANTLVPYLNGKALKKINILWTNYEGCVDYDYIIDFLTKEGLTFKGPKSRQELEELITNGKKTDIIITMDFTKKETKSNEEENKEKEDNLETINSNLLNDKKTVKTKVLSLFKRKY